MSLLPITLGVRQSPDAQASGGKRKTLKKDQLKALHAKVLERDHFTCRYCGFASKQFQRVIPKDWAASGQEEAELVTACVFCEQCFALESVAPMGSGVLIWLPDISQAALHHIMRAIYAARAHGDAMPEKIRTCAQRAFDVILHARGEAKRRIGTDDPAALASVFLESIDAGTYAKRGHKLAGIRLMPLDRRLSLSSDADQFPRMATYWISPDGPFGQYAPEKWEHMARFAQKAA